MVKLLLLVFLPMVSMLLVGFVLRAHRKIERPSPLVMGCMIPKLCAVDYEETLGDIKKLNRNEKLVVRRLRWEAQRKDFRLNWLYLCEEAANTVLFLRVLRFEDLRINPKKSGMKYEDREVVILDLIDDTVGLRWKQVRSQLILVLRARLGLTINKEIFVGLLEEYKQLEEKFVDFAGMQSADHQRMMIDKLGLGNWGMINGGKPEPA